MSTESPLDRNHLPAELSPAEVEDLKRKFTERPGLFESVCGQIAVSMHVRDGGYDGRPYASPDEERKAFEETAFKAGQTAASYALSLRKALDAPGSEWPLTANTTDWITDALTEVKPMFFGSDEGING